MTFARASLVAGDTTLILPINPYTAQWSYQEVVNSEDTIGGRVVQLLSVNVQGLQVTSVAGSRENLQKVATGLQQIMEYHVRTSQPAHFKVPSRGWDFKVYISAMPQVGWEVASTTYPYELQLSVQEDISGVQTHKIQLAALQRLSQGIGYNPNVHGGASAAFAQEVKSVLGATNGPGGTGSNTNDGGGATSGTSFSTTGGSSGVDQGKSTLSVDEIVAVAAWALSHFTSMNRSDIITNTIFATAVCLCESGGRPGAKAQGVNSTAYGLWQAAAGRYGIPTSALTTADGNAEWMAKEVQRDYTLVCGGPYALRTWQHAWWCYWGCFRGQGSGYLSHLSVARTAAHKYFASH